MQSRTFITVAEIKTLVAEIEALKEEPDAAHALEDNLLRAVLVAIVAGAPEPDKLAAAALAAFDIRFTRSYNS